MYIRLDRAHRALAVVLGVITLGIVAAVLLCDALPCLFPARSHDTMAAISLAGIALAYLVYQAAHRPGWKEWVKAVLLALAFVFWAANQVWPNQRQAILLNDLAIALFVLDVFLVMAGWPPTSPDESFGETYGPAADAAAVPGARES
jgi:peptidoglycan/LPS O-acetylase OafA/YrhL